MEKRLPSIGLLTSLSELGPKFIFFSLREFSSMDWESVEDYEKKNQFLSFGFTSDLNSDIDYQWVNKQANEREKRRETCLSKERKKFDNDDVVVVVVILSYSTP